MTGRGCVAAMLTLSDPGTEFARFRGNQGLDLVREVWHRLYDLGWD